MNDEMSFQQKSLFQQGYQSYTTEELKELEWGLRFTPAVCTSLTIVALIMQWPALAFIVSGLGIWAFFFPTAHPMDVIYNQFIRKLFGAVELPPNPLQRRMACLSAGILNFAIGLLFLGSMPLAAYGVGLMLVTLQLIVISSHFCALSWMYEGVMRLLGRWEVPISMEETSRLIDQGAQIIDVRSELEFSKGHLENAINIPVDDIENRSSDFSRKTTLLCCASGMRSQVAHHKLTQAGIDNVYDIGAINTLKSRIPMAN